MSVVEEFRVGCERLDGLLQDRGILIPGQGDARSDWKNLAKSLGDDFYAKVRQLGIAEYLISEPPRRRLNVAGQAEWGPNAEVIKDIDALIMRGVRQVRNNLSHGNKAGLEPRDSKLIEEANAVLKLALSQLTGNCSGR